MSLTRSTDPDELVLHRLTRYSPDVDETLAALFALSMNIFPPDPSSSPRTSSQMEHWHSRLEHPSSSIIYLSLASAPVALLCIYPRTHDPPITHADLHSEEGIHTTVHVWLAGVREDMRARGCLAWMMRELQSDVLCAPGPADMHTSSVSVVTICTSPAKFGTMWAWLRKRGWAVEREFPDVPGKVQLVRILHRT